jgi:hypothetical protein
MVEINISRDRAAVRTGDVVRYDGPIGRPGDVDKAWHVLAVVQRHPLWAYDPEWDADPEPWTLLVTTGGADWDRRWGWDDLPPTVTLVLRGGTPVGRGDDRPCPACDDGVGPCTCGLDDEDVTAAAGEERISG